MSRPIQYDRSEVLERATMLFWQHGYSQTSVRALLNATGFNRHSLYETFGGKKGLFVEVLSHYKHKFMDQLISDLKFEGSDIETLRALFARHAQLSNQQIGCLVSNTSNEKHEVDADVHTISTDYLEELEEAMQICIRHAKEKGQIPADKNEYLYARYLVTLLHGFGPLSKSSACSDDIVRFGELYIESLQSQLQPEGLAA